MNDSNPAHVVPINTTQVVENVNLTTAVQEVPQIQTTVTENGPEITSIINAPFVQVTSVNGKTGDVTLDASIKAFQPNGYYPKDSVCTHLSSLYIAKQTFTAGASFNPDDWVRVQGGGSVQSDWNISDTDNVAYIKNKPTKLNQIDSAYIPFTQAEKTKLAGLDKPFTQAEKTKLAGIEAGAQKNVPQVQSDWTQDDPSNVSHIKNKPSGLVIDSGYVHTDNNFTDEMKYKVDQDYIQNQPKSVKSNNIDFASIPNYEYKETEVNTGKRWIDGRPIFRKVVRGRINLSGNVCRSIPHNITGLTDSWEVVSWCGCIGLGGVLSNNRIKQALPYTEHTHQAGISSITNTNMTVCGSYAWGLSEVSVVLEYVK